MSNDKTKCCVNTETPVNREELSYWEKKRQIEKDLAEPEIMYELKDNKCICRQKA